MVKKKRVVNGKSKVKKGRRKAKGKRKSSIKELYDLPSMKKMFYCCVAGVLIAVVIIIANRCDGGDNEICCYCENATVPIRSESSFMDVRSEQLLHAKANGLKKPIKDRKEFDMMSDSLIAGDKLVKIKPNRYYNISRLTHSLSYLTPEAKDLLNIIGKRFQANLKKAGMPRYKYQLSSLLRTVEFQRDLAGTDVNAVPDLSAHYYGTTFDIAYDRYDYRGENYCDPEIEEVLENTLRELREECRLLIIREKSNKCFHITVVCCDSEK